MNKELVYIDIVKIHPHPKNPRKDLGDLTELAESIKVNGVMQNLTVILWNSADERTEQKEEYRVVIGHRRLAAAKLAGLDKVPCTISDMTEKQQVATMLLENMQRNDLTLLEQAQGMQMMIDFGDTVSSISQATGLSKSTVLRRVKLLELDQDKLAETMERHVTLADYAELDKIESIELKNKVLESIGTDNFRYELKRALDSEKAEKNKAELLPILDSFAVKIKNTAELSASGIYVQYMRYINLSSLSSPFEKPEDAGEKKYYYTLNYGAVELYRERDEVEAAPSISKEQQELRERRSKLNEISERMFELRFEFVKSYSPAQAKKHSSIIMELASRVLFINDSYGPEAELFKLLDIEENEEKLIFSMLSEKAPPEKLLLVLAYLHADGGMGDTYHDWSCEYTENTGLDMLYDTLTKLGYQMSDEEKAMRDGTHELYVKEEDDK